jgi:quercetin dioxygenase-like cupin family protein
MKVMRSVVTAGIAVTLVGIVVGAATALEEKSKQGAHGGKAEMPEPFFKIYKDLKWEKLNPELGESSPELCILHLDPKTKATKMLIRNSVAIGGRKHWHTANETHTVIHGQVTYECDGKRAQLGPGSFNYIPSKMIHEAWSSAGALVFVTLDGPWDLNYVDHAPTAADIIKDPNAFFAEPSE